MDKDLYILPRWMGGLGTRLSMKLYLQKKLGSETGVVILRMRTKSDVYNTTLFSVTPENWDYNLRRIVRGGHSVDGTSAGRWDEVLDEIHDACASYMKEIGSALPSMTRIRGIVKEALGKPARTQSLSTDYNNYIIDTARQRHWHDNTLRRERYVMRLFLEHASKDSYENYTPAYMEAFAADLNQTSSIRDENLKKVLGSIYRFLQWAKLHGRPVPDGKYIYQYSRSRGAIVYLSKDELRRIVSYQVPATGAVVKITDMRGRPKEKTVAGSSGICLARDFLLFLSLTGLRYSELQGLCKQNYRSAEQSGTQYGMLVFVADKTDSKREVELNRFAYDILCKYKKKASGKYLFPRLSGQKANAHIHDLAELCEINEPVTEMRIVNGEKVETITPKYMHITTHTGRKTFVCQALLSGIPPETIILWTGHTSVDDLAPYISAASDAGNQGMKRLYNQLFLQ